MDPLLRVAPPLKCNPIFSQRSNWSFFKTRNVFLSKKISIDLIYAEIHKEHDGSNEIGSRSKKRAVFANN